MNAPANVASLEAIQAASVLVLVSPCPVEAARLLVPYYDPRSLVRGALAAAMEKIRAADGLFSRESIRNVKRWVTALGVPARAADDVVGDVLLRAWESWDRFDPAQGGSTNPTGRRARPSEQGQGWLNTVAVRCASRSRKRAKCSKEILVRRAPRQEETAADPLTLLVQRESEASRSRALYRALDGLRPAWREAVIELRILETSAAELAKRRNVAPGVIWARCSKACAALRRRLGHLYAGHEGERTHG